MPKDYEKTQFGSENIRNEIQTVGLSHENVVNQRQTPPERIDNIREIQEQSQNKSPSNFQDDKMGSPERIMENAEVSLQHENQDNRGVNNEELGMQRRRITVNYRRARGMTLNK